ncbi:MAG: hypothetical protein WC299_10825 [Kiritimatiellia bacterium]
MKKIILLFGVAWCILPVALSSAASSRPDLIISLGGKLVDHLAEMNIDPAKLDVLANYYAGMPPGPKGEDQGGVQFIVYAPEQHGMPAVDFYNHILAGVKGDNDIKPSDLTAHASRGISRYNPDYNTILAAHGSHVIMLTAYDPKKKINIAAHARDLMARLGGASDPFNAAFKARLGAMSEELRQMEQEQLRIQEQIRKLDGEKSQTSIPPAVKNGSGGDGEVELASGRNIPAELDAARRQKQVAELREKLAGLARRQAEARAWISYCSSPEAVAQLRQMAAVPEKAWNEQKAEAARVAAHYADTLRKAEESLVAAEREKTMAAAEAGKDFAGKSDQIEAEKKGEARGTARMAPEAGSLNDRLRQAADKRDSAAQAVEGYRKALEQEQQRLRLLELAGEVRGKNTGR